MKIKSRGEVRELVAHVGCCFKKKIKHQVFQGLWGFYCFFAFLSKFLLEQVLGARISLIPNKCHFLTLRSL